MSNLTDTDKIFFDKTGMDRRRVEGIVDDALHGMDDGELFLEYTQSESLALDDGHIKSASFDTSRGFGLRAISGESTGYSHASELTEEAIKRAAETVKAVKRGSGGVLAAPPPGTNRHLYIDDNPLAAVDFTTKVKLLTDIDAYGRGKDPRVRQVMASLVGEWQAVQIVRPDGSRAADVRPLVRLNVAVVTADGERMESGSYGTGGRTLYDHYLKPETWQAAVDEALRQALVNLNSVPAPAGEMTVVLGPGWPGILLHEAIGHGLEGDFNRKKTSAFSGLLNQRIASPGITVVDDYGHHPTEIRATLATARDFVGSGRVIAIFQPHRFSRTQAFAAEFASELNSADLVYLLEIYPASEKPIPGITSHSIASKMDASKVIYEPSMPEVIASVVKQARAGDLILTLGAGDVSSLAPLIIANLSE